jgi:Flp pilus assembly protein TadG
MRLVDRDRGAALVEAALVIPFLLLLTFGIWTTARAWNINNTMEHAAREAARYGATVEPWDPNTSPGEVRAVADADMASAAIDTSAIQTVCIELVADGETACSTTHTNNTGTDQVFVRLEYPNYELQFLFFSMTIDMQGTAISRHEAP